nr:hypothetical protein [Bacteroides intestinalis]
MRIIHIALQHNRKFEEQLFIEKVIFLTKHPYFIPLVLTANYIRNNYNLAQSDKAFLNGILSTWDIRKIPVVDEQKWKDILGINETTETMWPSLKAAFENMTAEKAEKAERLIRDEIGYDMADFLDNISENAKKDIRRKVIPVIETPLQKYWLAWLDDFFEEIVFEEIANLSPDTSATSLVVVTFPEFIYSYPKQIGDSFALYRKSVISCFLSGTLPDNLQRRPTIPKLRKLKNIQSRFMPCYYNILVVPGTIVWKHYPTQDSKYVLYNTIPVFHQNKCIFAWDKQNASSIDVGKGKHQHSAMDEFLDEKTNQLFFDGTISLSDLSMRINQNQKLNPAPCFKITHINQTLNIGLSTCLDFAFSKYFIGMDGCQIQILIADGLYCPWRVNPQIPSRRIVAKTLFIYCDKAEANEIGYAIMLSRNNKALWQQNKCEWDTIDSNLCNQQLKERRDKLIEENRMLSIDIQTVNF